MTPIQYEGYTIQPAWIGFDFFKTDEGIDCWNDGDGWKSNVKHASSIENAKAEIDDIIYEEEQERRLEKAGEMNHLKEQDTER